MAQEQFSIKHWRQVRDISQEEMAYRLGIHVNTYRRMEKKPMNIKIGMLLTICDILDVEAESILMDTEQAENAEEM